MCRFLGMPSLCWARQIAWELAGRVADITWECRLLAGLCQRRVVWMKKDTFRVVTRGADGEIRFRDYDSKEDLLRRHTQVGIDDCSTDLELRGLPVFRGLIGPMPEGENVIRYESPEVFETLTKEWSTAKTPRRTRTRARTTRPQT